MPSSDSCETLLEILIEKPEDFLKVAESLTRIGIPSLDSGAQILYQSCHILFKRGRYFLVHFKEMFALDGRSSSFSRQDLERRNSIASLLEDWSLIRIIRPEDFPMCPKSKIKVIKFAEKKDWELRPKYKIGDKDVKRSSSTATDGTRREV